MSEVLERAELLTAMTDPEKYRNLRWNLSCGKGGFAKEQQTEDFQETLQKNLPRLGVLYRHLSP